MARLKLNVNGEAVEAEAKETALLLRRRKRDRLVLSFDAFENYGRNPSGFVT